jgi:hypothetical protein
MKKREVHKEKEKQKKEEGGRKRPAVSHCED